MSKFLTRIRRVTLVLAKYKDQETTEELTGYVRHLEGMLAAVRKDSSSEDYTSKFILPVMITTNLTNYDAELPKVLRDALERLATKVEVQSIDSLIRASLENITGDLSEPLDLDLDAPVDINDWKEGVEELSKWSEEKLWQLLGLPGQQLPFFQEWTDPDAQITAWTPEGRKWLDDPASPRQRLRPRWHQLVGIFRMLQRAFEGRPVLLMDGVGLGKTLQVLGAVACLAWYTEYYEHHKKFPGHFGESFLI